MKRSIFRLTFRKMRGHLPQLLGMGLLILIGAAFFVTLYTIHLSYQQNGQRLFNEQGYANVTFYGSFDEDDVKRILMQEGIDDARGRRVQDYRDGDVTLRVISLTGPINMPYLYEGRFPRTNDECLLLKKHAQAKGIALGGMITVDGKPLRVTGIAASPEYVYLVQNERTLMAKSDRFGVLFVSPGFFDEPYNEIVAAGRIGKDLAQAAGKLVGTAKTVLKEDQLNYSLYRDDLDQIRTFAYIFPLVFAILIIMIIYVILKRAAQKERRQIGVLKALGVGGLRILLLYVAQAGVTALLGAAAGCIAAMLLCDTIIGILSIMFEVPGLHFVFYPVLWLGAILLSMAVCMLSALVSVRGVLKPMPAELIRPRMPAGGKQLLLERLPILWSRLSFNTRYALKSALRNKGRFLAVVLGMCGSCALMTFALGFFNSVEHTQSAYFEEFARYDALLEFEPILLSVKHPAANRLDKINKALAVPVVIEGKEYRLFIVENDFDMLNIDTEALKDGVIIPDYYAGQWGVGAGGKLSINGMDAKVAGLSEQSVGLALFTGYDYVKKILPVLPPVYNVIFLRSGNLAELADLSSQYGFAYSTLKDARTGFSSVMESLNTLIWFMLACSIILGLTVLYSIGLMNLSSREYEYMFMGVMGYPLRSILAAHVKETLLQLLLAIPLGFVLGFLMLNAVKAEFSSDSFVILTAIFPQSRLYAGAMVTAMAAFMAIISARRMNRLDIVEGLKARDE